MSRVVVRRDGLRTVVGAAEGHKPGKREELLVGFFRQEETVFILLLRLGTEEAQAAGRL